MKAICLLVLAMSVSILEAEPPGPDKARKPEWMKKAELKFGLFKGERFLFEEVEFRYREGLTYGWVLHLQEVPGRVEVKEVFLLPGKAKWKIDEPGADELKAAGKRAETVKVLEAAVKGAERGLANAWTIAKGDPQGKYVMEISLNGHKFKRIEFVVWDLKKDPRWSQWQKEKKAKWEKMWKSATPDDLGRWFQDPEKGATEWENRHGLEDEDQNRFGLRGRVLEQLRDRKILKRGMSREAVLKILGKTESGLSKEIHYAIGPVDGLTVKFDEAGNATHFCWHFEGEANAESFEW